MKKVFFIFLVSMFLVAGVHAEYRVYDNVEDFENANGSVCEAASDGCNSYFMTDGKVMGGTLMFCEDHKAEWTCTKYKEGVMTTRGLEATTTAIDEIEEEQMMCTMDYSPVCAEVQVQCITTPCNPILQTFGNACGAGDNKILYTGECKMKKELSQNDQNFYVTIQKRLDDKYQNLVNKAVLKYESKLMNYSNIKKEKVNKYIIQKLEKKISDLLLQYPADIGLPKKVNDKYLTYTLLKFELMKLEY